MLRLKEEMIREGIRKKNLDIKVFRVESEKGFDYYITYDGTKMRSNIINKAFKSAMIFSNVFYIPDDLMESWGGFETLKNKRII